MGLFIVHRTRIMYAPMPLPNNTPCTHTHTHTGGRARARARPRWRVYLHSDKNTRHAEYFGPTFYFLFLDIIDTRIL